MLIDTHAHINMMVKNQFDVPLTLAELDTAKIIIEEAAHFDVKRMINVGTSLVESINCIQLAQRYREIYAAVGIHPNDCTVSWYDDMHKIKKLVSEKEKNKSYADEHF